MFYVDFFFFEFLRAWVCFLVLLFLRVFVERVNCRQLRRFFVHDQKLKTFEKSRRALHKAVVGVSEIAQNRTPGSGFLWPGSFLSGETILFTFFGFPTKMD